VQGFDEGADAAQGGLGQAGFAARQKHGADGNRGGKMALPAIKARGAGAGVGKAEEPDGAGLGEIALGEPGHESSWVRRRWGVRALGSEPSVVCPSAMLDG
jgi:hypothetical protein